MITISVLVWDKWNIEHIRKHQVTRAEVEELCFGKFSKQPSYQGRILILGRLKSGRALTVILSKEKDGQYYPVTARDMSKKERKKFL